MTEQFNYKDIGYSLKKSNRKTISIFIERDGSVSILAPAPYELEKIEQVIEAKRGWIYRNLAEWEDLNRTQLHREFVNGEGFIYLGRSYRLSLEENQHTDLGTLSTLICLVFLQYINFHEVSCILPRCSQYLSFPLVVHAQQYGEPPHR